MGNNSVITFLLLFAVANRAQLSFDAEIEYEESIHILNQVII